MREDVAVVVESSAVALAVPGYFFFQHEHNFNSDSFLA